MKTTHIDILHLPTGKPLANTAHIADNYFSRLRGLIGRPPMTTGEAMWIIPCQQVHTHFMKVPLDIVFLDRGHTVLHIEHNMRPWKLSPWIRQARSVLELPPGSTEAVKVGDRLQFIHPQQPVRRV